MTATEKAGKMSDKELYSLFTGNQFYEDPELAMAAVQEAENREALRSGRKPITIRFDKLEGSTLGQCGKDTIVLDSSFLTKDVTGIRTPAQLLGVILHEGRHAWQHMILDDVPEGLSRDMYYSLLADNTCYVSPSFPLFSTPLGTNDPEFEVYAQYAVQENEMDARFYALSRMEEIIDLTSDKYAMAIEIAKLKAQEVHLIEKICKDFNEDILEKLEMNRKNSFLVRTGKELPEDCEYFKNFRIILRVIKPLFTRLEELEEKGTVIDCKNITFALYAASRKAELEGFRLETPEQLISYMIDHSFELEPLGLEPDVFRNEIGSINKLDS